MDAADARGDGAAGVATLPVLTGRRATLRLAAACELAAAGCWSRGPLGGRGFPGSGRRGAFSLVIPAAAVALGAALVLPAAGRRARP